MIIIYRIIKKRRSIGKQYYWLACLSKSYDNLEQCFHKEDRGQLISTQHVPRLKSVTHFCRSSRGWIIYCRMIKQCAHSLNEETLIAWQPSQQKDFVALPCSKIHKVMW